MATCSATTWRAQGLTAPSWLDRGLNPLVAGSSPARPTFGHVDALTRNPVMPQSRSMRRHCPLDRVAVVLPLRGGHLSAITSRSSQQPYRGHFGQPCCPTLWCRRRRARTPLRSSCSAPTTTGAFSYWCSMAATTLSTASILPRTRPATRLSKCTTLSLWATASSASTGASGSALSVADDHPPRRWGSVSVEDAACITQVVDGRAANQAVSFLTATKGHASQSRFHRLHG